MALFAVLIFHVEGTSQCTPNTIAFHGSQPIFNTACGNNSYQTIDGSVPSPNNGNQTFQWDYSLNGGSFTLISSTGVDLPKDDITDLILAVNGNATGNYAIRRIVNDDNPVCSDISSPVFLYYAQNSSQTTGGSITPANTTSCFMANGTLTLQNHSGPIHRWEISVNAGTWSTIANTTNTYTYSLNVGGTYCYRALIDDVCSGTVGSIDLANDDYSAQACVNVIVQPPAISTCAVTRNISGCSTSVISNPSFSTIEVASSLGVFTGPPNNGVVTNNCGVEDVLYVDEVLNTSCPITVRRTWTIGDAGGNTSTCFQTINVIDNIHPAFGPGASNQMVECDGAGNEQALTDWVNNYGGASATDACSAVTWSHDFTTLSDNCGATGSAIVHFTATDGCGNANTTTATFTISDLDAPVITTPASPANSECEGANADSNTGFIAWLANKGGAAANDICGNNVIWTNNSGPQSWSGSCTQSITITFTATDDCGNASSTTAIYTIEDHTPPAITTQASAVSSECQGANPDVNTGYLAWLSNKGGAVASDLCGNGVTWTNNSGPQSWSGSCTQTITITFTATDDCGNASSTTATYTITDLTRPDITTPATIGGGPCEGLNPDANTAFIAWLDNKGGAVANDICGNGVSWTNNTGPQVWSGSCSQSITITFTATDDCGNANSTTATFTISDINAPVITTPASPANSECEGVNADSNTGFIAWLANRGGAAANDVCGNGVTWTNNSESQSWSGSCTQTITITFTATDDCGNASSTTAIYTIEDHTPPAITTQASAASSECQGANPDANTGYLAWLSNKGGAVASDLCGNGVIWTNNNGPQTWSGSCTQTITITFTATDDCGNASSTTATYTITDLTQPAITTPASIGGGPCEGLNPDANTAFIAWLDNKGGAVANDICGNGVTWTNNTGPQVWSGSCSQSITITFTATDDCGNANSTTAIFTISDLDAPVITTPASPANSECQGTNPDSNTGFTAWLANKGGAAANDICGNNVTWTNNSGPQTWSGSCIQSITITFTATDDCGNASSTTATYTIEDHTSPSITTQASAGSSECQGANPDANTGYLTWLSNKGGAVASDLCGNGVTWTNNNGPQSWSGSCTQTITITFTATDDCGNASSTTATYTITDHTSPSITTSAEAGNSECQGSNPDANTNYLAWLENKGGAVASDLCNNGVTWTNNNGPQVWSGTCTKTIMITFIATDNCGNSSSTTATFTITDNTGPSISTPSSSGNAQCQGVNPDANTGFIAWLGNRGGAQANDLCGNGVTWTNNSGPQVWTGTCTQTITITFTATDNCGRANSTTATFTIDDQTIPSASNPPTTNVQCFEAIPAPNVLVVTNEADNCDPEPTVTFVEEINNDGTGCNSSPYILTRTYRVEDDCGNSRLVTHLVRVVDNVGPALICPPNVRIECSASTLPEQTGIATATDNCGSTPTVTFTSTQNFGNEQNGSTRSNPMSCPISMCSSIPSLPNETSHRLIVDVDPVPFCGFGPTFEFSGDIQNGAQQDDCLLDVNGDGNFEERCFEFVLVRSSNSPVGAVQFAFGKGQGCTGELNMCFADIDGECEIVGNGGSGNMVGPLYFVGDTMRIYLCDNSSGNVSLCIFCTEPEFCATDYTITRTWQATDDCGNSSNCTQIIKVEDNTPPVIGPLPEPSIIECPATPNFTTPTVNDICDANPVLTFNDITTATDCVYEYSVTRTWTSTDICSNSSMASQTITVSCNDLPDPGTISGTSPLCIGTTNTFTTTGNEGGAWSSTNTSVASVDEITGLVSALMPGLTDIVYTVGSPCNGTGSSMTTLNVKAPIVLNPNDTGDGSLREIISCASSGSTITFDPVLMGQTITLTTGEIMINKNLVLSGMGALNLSVSGNNTSRIFNLLPAYNFSIKNLTLKNTTSVVNGGAIFAKGNLTLENVIFQNNFENGTPKSLTIMDPALISVIGNVEIKN